MLCERTCTSMSRFSLYATPSDAIVTSLAQKYSGVLQHPQAPTCLRPCYCSTANNILLITSSIRVKINVMVAWSDLEVGHHIYHGPDFLDYSAVLRALQLNWVYTTEQSIKTFH